MPSVNIANTTAGISGDTLVTASDAVTITGAHTFDRDPSAPFLVTASSAVVTNLDADLLDGQQGTYYRDAGNINAGTLALARGGTAVALTDPNADRILFWDDSAGQLTWLVPNTGLAISGTNLNLSHLGIDALTDPNADRIMFWDDSAGAAAWLTAGAGLTISGTTITGPVAPYTVTRADVANTAAQTTTLSFSVPANDMADGDVLEITTSVLIKNNKGTNGTVAWDWFWGATTVNLFAAVTWTNNATESKYMLAFRLQRVGADLWMFGEPGLTGDARDLYSRPGYDLSNGAPGHATVMSAPSFTTTQTVALKLTLSAADVNFYFKPQAARVHKFGA